MAYAAQTTVPPERSVEQIQKILRDRGCQRIAYMEEPSGASIMFETQHRACKFTLTKVSPGDRLVRDARDPAKAAMQEWWRRWRVLQINIKAMFEVVDAGIQTFEQVFMSALVTSSGETLYEAMEGVITADEGSGPLVSMEGLMGAVGGMRALGPAR